MDVILNKKLLPTSLTHCLEEQSPPAPELAQTVQSDKTERLHRLLSSCNKYFNSKYKNVFSC